MVSLASITDSCQGQHSRDWSKRKGLPWATPAWHSSLVPIGTSTIRWGCRIALRFAVRKHNDSEMNGALFATRLQNRLTAFAALGRPASELVSVFMATSSWATTTTSLKGGHDRDVALRERAVGNGPLHAGDASDLPDGPPAQWKATPVQAASGWLGQQPGALIFCL